MKRSTFLIVSIIILFVLTGFAHQDKLKINDIGITINNSQKTIQYDFKIKNTGNMRIGNEFDYPGYQYGGMEIVVVPGKNLEPFMKMMKDTKYKKMEPAGFGGQGFIDPKEIADFHAEYFFKDIKDLKKVRKFALDGKLVVLDGPIVIAELPLK